ncbi:MAG: LicD family protein [Clostridia bacterium]|nr:LicD family protein [Clostridia bacterium]
MNELQAKILDILKWTDALCRAHQIRYYLMGGSMLGAVRHKGFIPWDDDIDIAVPREDYERLYEILSRQESDTYCVETYQNGNKDFIYPYMKIYDKTTTVVEKSANRIKRGVFLDVFPIDGMADFGEEQQKHFKRIRRNVNLLSAKVCAWRKERKFYKNMAIVAAKFIPAGSRLKLLARIDALCKRYEYDSSECVGVLSGTYGEKEIMPRAYYGEPTEYEFEGMRFFGVEQYDLYLKKLYGNYMQPPPEDKRQSPHDFLCCELDKPYQKA